MNPNIENTAKPAKILVLLFKMHSAMQSLKNTIIMNITKYNISYWILCECVRVCESVCEYVCGCVCVCVWSVCVNAVYIVCV